jgi:hypothetical protein
VEFISEEVDICVVNLYLIGSQYNGNTDNAIKLLVRKKFR